MKLPMVLNKKRAVSPVIATILLISVSLAAGTAVSIILSNVEDSTPTVETESALGVVGTSSLDELSLSSDVTQLSGDIVLMQQNVFDYVSLTIELTYTGENAFIYVIDFDILVYGIKLDDISPWTIVSAQGATFTTVNGEYGGFKHATGDTVQYVLEVEDKDNPLARVQDKTTFSYEIKIGEDPGVISHKTLKERESKVIFEFISYNVSIFHFGSNFAQDNAATQLENTLSTINGTNNLFFIYNRANDAFDISDSQVVSNINTTAMTEEYQIIMVDKWLVPNGAGQLLLDLHNNGIDLMFYGTIEEFDPNNEDFNNVISKIDYAATKNITGLVPDVYTGNRPKGTVNGYKLFGIADGVLTGLVNEEFWEVPNKAKKVRGDRIGFDAADLTNEVEKFDVLGNSTYQFYSKDKAKDIVPKNLIWSNNGPLLIRKNGITNGSGDVYSFVWKTHEKIDDRKATKVNQGHLSTVRKNMLLSLVGQLERQVIEYAELSIDKMEFNMNGNKKFDMEITLSVSKADINGGTLVVTVDMPDNLRFEKPDQKYNVYINGSKVVNKERVFINETGNVNTVTFDIGTAYSSDIPENSVILIVMKEKPSDGKWIKLKNSDTNNYDWFVTADFASGIFAFNDQETYSIYTALDTNVWP